jgi:hypothetical protein
MSINNAVIDIHRNRASKMTLTGLREFREWLNSQYIPASCVSISEMIEATDRVYRDEIKRRMK